MPEDEIYVLTPMVVLGPQRYNDLREMAERIAEKKYGKNAKGVPVLIFDGKGGHFDMAQLHND